MTAYAALEEAVRAAAPRWAVVLGSGLGRVMDACPHQASVPFAAVPGFAAPTVAGHGGRLLLADWQGQPLLVFLGRIHYYEGHPWPRVLAPIRLAAALGCRALLLTNAAGGIRADLAPGDFLALRGHLPLLDADAWRQFARGQPPPSPYSQPLTAWLNQRGLPTGVYAGMIGPTYETPAEIRALRALGADAVGMSTVREAEEAQRLGLAVAAVSCITNKAAGISASKLDHQEVADVAGQPLSVQRLQRILDDCLAAPIA